MAHYPHLLNRNGHYHFRLSVPADLVHRFDCRELTCSLKTKNRMEAQIRCSAMRQVALWIFMKIKNTPRLTPEEAKKIAQAYFKECLRRLDWQLDTADGFSRQMVQMANAEPRLAELKELDLTHDAFRQDFLLPDNFSYGNPEDPEEVTGMRLGYHNHFDGDQGKIVRYVAQKNDIEVLEGTLSYNTLQKAVGRAVQELSRLHNLKANLEPDAEIKDDWFKDARALPVAGDHIPDAESSKVSELKDTYIAECEKNGNDDRTIRYKTTVLDTWLDVMGDTPVNTITKKTARAFKESLLALPSNMTKRYPGKTAKEVLAQGVPEAERMKAKTINGYIGMMQTFIKWAQDNGYCNEGNNPFSGMSLKDKTRKKDKRFAFSDEQLQAIFSTPVFTGCKGKKPLERYQEGSIIVKDNMYWIPLIALYTGARMGEICQLYVSDIKKIGDIWVFDFNDEGDDKKLKTDTSKRKVPIHPKLIELGLLKHQQEMKDQDETRLFPDAALSSDGTYVNIFSKRFSGFLKRFDIKTDKTSFHSFRHTVKDTFLTHTNVPEELRRAIMGHDKGDVHGDYGSADMPLKKLHEAIKQLRYDATDKVT